MKEEWRGRGVEERGRERKQICEEGLAEEQPMYNNISLPSWPAEKAFWTQLCLYFFSTLTSPVETHSCHASLPFPVQISHYKQHYIGQIWRSYRPARHQAPAVDRVKAKSTQLYIKIGFASATGGKFKCLSGCRFTKSQRQLLGKQQQQSVSRKQRPHFGFSN